MVATRRVETTSSRQTSLPLYMWANRSALAGAHRRALCCSRRWVWDWRSCRGAARAGPRTPAAHRRTGGARRRHDTDDPVAGDCWPSWCRCSASDGAGGGGLWLYALFPILRNTYTGLRDANPAAVQAATALGMTDSQVLQAVRLPLAAADDHGRRSHRGVITVGTATLAAFIGAGGLGEPIVSGVQAVDPVLILSGALPAARLALAVDAVLGRVERSLRPAGLEARH
jgi:hypothetical protein